MSHSRTRLAAAVALAARAHRSWIEPLEPRRMLSLTLEDGLIVYRGTAADDYVLVVANPWNEPYVMVFDDSDVPVVFRREEVRGIVMYGGDGNDRLGACSGGSFHIPMTLIGGGGDDSLLGGSGAGLLVGGAGEDYLDSRVVYADAIAPVSDQEPVAVGEELLVHAGDGPDTLVGDGTAAHEYRGGAAAERVSVHVHRGTLRINTLSDCEFFEVSANGQVRYGTAGSYILSIPDLLGYATSGRVEVRTSRYADHAQLDAYAARIGVEVFYDYYDPTPAPASDPQPVPEPARAPDVPEGPAQAPAEEVTTAAPDRGVDDSGLVPAPPGVVWPASGHSPFFASPVKRLWDDAAESA
jgi:hypothetical protein